MAAAKTVERSADKWFQEAERTYTEKHQGCPWCGGSHRVFCQRRGLTVIFYCQGCDFQASHDAQTNRYVMIPGLNERPGVIPETMFGSPKTMSS